jgi:hypothetical protein
MVMLAAPVGVFFISLLLYSFQSELDLFVYRSYTSNELKREPIFVFSAVGSLAFAVVSALMVYLQTGFRQRTNSTESGLPVLIDALRRVEAHVKDGQRAQTAELDQLRQKLVGTDKALGELRTQHSVSLDSNERAELMKLLREQLQSSTFSEVVEGLKKQWTLDLDRESQVRIVGDQMLGSKTRLDSELHAVNRRGNLNLSIGIATTISGLLLLGLTVFERYTGGSEYKDILLHYLPRLSLVIFIEIFAYFFLKLYKASLTETKYYQNELTNIESKFTALLVALHRPQELGAAAAVASMSTTERNFLLKTGESTVDIEAL